jgi:hypothetical protein
VLVLLVWCETIYVTQHQFAFSLVMVMVCRWQKVVYTTITTITHYFLSSFHQSHLKYVLDGMMMTDTFLVTSFSLLLLLTHPYAVYMSHNNKHNIRIHRSFYYCQTGTRCLSDDKTFTNSPVLIYVYIVRNEEKY